MNINRPVIILFVCSAMLLLPVKDICSQTKEEADKKSATSLNITETQIANWVKQLSHEQFSKRELASKALVKAGVRAVDLLAQQAKSKDLEVALRAVNVLGDIYNQAGKSGNSKSFQATETALTTIASINQRTVSLHANALLENQSEARTKFALFKIQQLGGIITWTEPVTARADFSELEQPRQVLFILLGKKWKGNDESLQLFRRIPQLPTLMISGTKKNSPVSEKGIDFLMRTFPGLSIQYRGTACLGVKGFDTRQNVGVQPLQGCTITYVKPKSAAANGGLIPGDVVVQFGKKKVTNFQLLIEAISDHTPGEKVPAQILRNGKAKTLQITLLEWNP